MQHNQPLFYDCTRLFGLKPLAWPKAITCFIIQFYPKTCVCIRSVVCTIVYMSCLALFIFKHLSKWIRLIHVFYHHVSVANLAHIRKNLSSCSSCFLFCLMLKWLFLSDRLKLRLLYCSNILLLRIEHCFTEDTSLCENRWVIIVTLIHVEMSAFQQYLLKSQEAASDKPKLADKFLSFWLCCHILAWNDWLSFVLFAALVKAWEIED